MVKMIAALMSLFLFVNSSFAEIGDVSGTIFELVKNEGVSKIQIGDHDTDNKEDVYYIDGNGDIKVFVQSNATVGGGSTLSENWFRSFVGTTISSVMTWNRIDFINNDTEISLAHLTVSSNEDYLTFNLTTSRIINIFEITALFTSSTTEFHFSVEGSDDGGVNWSSINNFVRGINVEINAGNPDYDFISRSGGSGNETKLISLETDNSVEYDKYRLHIRVNSGVPQLFEIRARTRL